MDACELKLIEVAVCCLNYIFFNTKTLRDSNLIDAGGSHEDSVSEYCKSSRTNASAVHAKRCFVLGRPHISDWFEICAVRSAESERPPTARLPEPAAPKVTDGVVQPEAAVYVETLATGGRRCLLCNEVQWSKESCVHLLLA